MGPQHLGTIVAAAATHLLALVVAPALVGCRTTSKTPAPSGTPAPPSSNGHYDIRASELPGPYATADATNPPKVVARPASAKLQMPPGFEISTFAEGGFQTARWITVAPNGDVFVAEAEPGRVTILRDAREGKATERFTFASGLTQPFGLAFWKDWLYVADTDAVVRMPYKSGDTVASAAPQRILDLPGKGYRQHWTRNILFSPDGSKLYVTVGSETNVDVEPDPMRAAITEVSPDGSAKRIFASGVRNPLGLAFHPATGKLWAAVQERDRIGDDLAPDFVTEIQPGGFYGWPYAYAGKNVDPRHEGERPDLVATTLVPDVLVQAHSAVIALVFYGGAMFPAEYQGDGFVSLHGSWNRSKRTGYKIIRIRMSNGRPVGGYDDFITGWMLDPDNTNVWGRPVGLAVLKDGSMLITDDGADKIWRLTYKP